MIVPSGASKASSVKPAAAKSAWMAGVASGGRRWRVQMTWPPGVQNPVMARMVDEMSSLADVAEHAAHQDQLAGTMACTSG